MENKISELDDIDVVNGIIYNKDHTKVFQLGCTPTDLFKSFKDIIPSGWVDVNKLE